MPDMTEARHFFFQAFPSISTGIYGYPVESATQVALGEVRKFLDTEEAKEACLVQVAIPTMWRVSLMGARAHGAVRARDLCGVFRGG